MYFFKYTYQECDAHDRLNQEFITIELYKLDTDHWISKNAPPRLHINTFMFIDFQLT